MTWTAIRIAAQAKTVTTVAICSLTPIVQLLSIFRILVLPGFEKNPGFRTKRLRKD
ncbi:hypothetical protein GALL_542360 [mine drainage metagenome]|uniref:Uncharacterized protein n=1 Tax=mine drainage metagenome TaxID=410659 RepID=A0A1J5P8T4_9ZZZZ